MERLTVKCDDGHWGLSLTVYDKAIPSRILEKLPIAIDRLAAYEDTMTIKRAQELAQAEKDGRMMVLPCKVGDTVWTNTAIVGDRYKSADRPYLVEVVFIGIGENTGFLHVQYSNGRIFPFDLDKIGKTVFLTIKEAEAALKKREADDEAD